MTTSPRTRAEAFQYAMAQHINPSQDWTGWCQKFVRSCYGIPPMFGTAFAQWLGADPEDRHVGGDPADAPLGSALCYKGVRAAGHIAVAARPFASGTAAEWSNDLVRHGGIDKAARTAPVSEWGEGYLGYLTAVNDYDLQLPVPKPKQTHRYKAIDTAIGRLTAARDRADQNHDRHDVRVLNREIRDLKTLYETLRRV